MNIQTLKNKILEDDVLNNISSFFDQKVYLVGGAVRDFLTGKSTFDRDLIVVDFDPKEFALKAAEFFQGKFIVLDEVNKIYRVVLKDKNSYLDITSPVENSLQKDIMRRDITINAIAVDIKTAEVIDLTCGISDLENKIIRGISPQNFIDDPLRMLRVFRFYSLLGFEIDPQTLDTVKKHCDLITFPAKERVEYELMKLFSGKYAHDALLKMDECGILEKIFPFVNELKKVPPNPHHHLDLFHHSVETVRQVQILYENSSQAVKDHLTRVDFGGFSRLAHLKFGCFMHDIGKFSTWTTEEGTGRHRFIKHEDVGAKAAVHVLKSLAFSNKQIDYLAWIIKKHMYPSAVVSAQDLNQKVMMRYVRRAQDNSIDTILIAQADRLSALGPEITPEIVEENISSLNKLLNFYLSVKDTLEPLPKLLDGNDVMRILNIKPSPLLGEIMDKLYEAQISADVLTKDDAVKFIKSLDI